MKQKIIIIGAGINGLVAANYLVRAGFDVTILERKDHPGGACCAGIWEHDGKQCEYPQGASVLGFMEKFVFEETGLSQKVQIHTPEHPEIIYARQGTGLISEDAKQITKEAREKWNEQGDVTGFMNDMERVVSFLQDGYRKAVVPTKETAIAALGKEIVERWITGSARNLLDHYLTSEALKLYFGVSVIESGPVSFDHPYSAFTIALMVSGSVFDGSWGYVKDGIWQIPIQLDAINQELGVERIFSAKVTSVENMTVSYEVDGKNLECKADRIIFATDPFTAANILGEKKLVDKISSETLLGTSGKLIMFFKQSARWKNDTGIKDFQSAFRHIIPVESLEELEESSNKVAENKADFTPGYYEVYCEGTGNRELGGQRDYDLVSIFFKNLAFGKHGAELPEVKQQVTDAILEYIENPEDLIHTILETPKDISEMFFFPKGNIDAVELTAGQTFFQRHYSPHPHKNFYQFGSNPDIYYCAAGSYPCGSVAGTPGYMCAQQIIKSKRSR